MSSQFYCDFKIIQSICLYSAGVLFCHMNNCSGWMYSLCLHCRFLLFSITLHRLCMGYNRKLLRYMLEWLHSISLCVLLFKHLRYMHWRVFLFVFVFPYHINLAETFMLWIWQLIVTASVFLCFLRGHRWHKVEVLFVKLEFRYVWNKRISCSNGSVTWGRYLERNGIGFLQTKIAGIFKLSNPYLVLSEFFW